METLTDNLVRVRPVVDAASVRSETSEGGARTLFGHFSVFDAWYEVDSVWEGRFMERTVNGAFTRTLSQRRAHIKAQYEHGKDPFVGAAPLGPFTILNEDRTGGYYEIALIDTDYNRERIIPQAEAGLLGASFRFRVAPGGEHWVEKPGKSDRNPEGIPERTITDTEVYELGPVVFGASPAATAAMRSGTDGFIDQLLSDPVFLARYVERVGAPAVERFLATLPPVGRNDRNTTDDAAPQGTSSGHRSAFLRSLTPVLEGV